MKNNKLGYVRLCVVAVLVFLSLFSSGCGGPVEQQEGELSGTLTISGAWALYPMVVRWGEEFHALHPSVDFDISAGGAGKGVTDVLAGAVDIGMVSREIYPDEIEQGAFWLAVTMDAVLPTMNTDNPYLAQVQARGLTRADFGAIWTGEITKWGELIGDPEADEAIHVYTRSDACGAAATWAEYLGGYKQEDLQGVAVYGDPGLATAVSEDALGIGFNNLNFAYDADTSRPVAKIQIIPIDLNENGQVDADENFYDIKSNVMVAIAEGRYPSPPARALYLVTVGKPDGLEPAFIRWVLADGQRFVGETGYIQLTQEQLQAQLNKLEGE